MKALVIALALMFSVGTVSAAEIDWFEDWTDEKQVLAVDAPYLVKLGDSWALGAEVSKDLHNTNSDEGWVVTSRVTYLGNLGSFFQKS